MNGVAVRPLRDVLRPRNDIVHPRENPTGIETFVGLEHIEPQTGRRVGAVPIDLASMTGRKARFLPGDIVYGYLRPYLNKVWIAEFAGFCSVDQYVFVVDEAVADAAYVASYLRSPAYLAAAPIDETPGQLPRIRLDEVLSTPIPLPSLDEQRRIAALLRELDSEVGQLQLSIESRTDAVRVTADTLVEVAFTARSPGTTVRTVGAVATIQTGYAFKSSWFRPNGVRLLRNANVLPDEVDWSDTVRLDPALEGSFSAYALALGDIVLALDRPVIASGLKIARLGERDTPSLLLQRVARVRPGPAVDADYLYGFMHTRQFRLAMSGHSQSLGVPHVSPRQVASVPIPLPPVDEQRRIAACLHEKTDEIDRARSALEAQRAAIDALSIALLREVFGEVIAA